MVGIFIGICILLVALVAWLVYRQSALVREQKSLTDQLRRANQSLAASAHEADMRNQEFKRTSESTMHELMQQDKLLHAVNDIASILLSCDMNEFDSALFQCLGVLGESAVVDRVYIWKNHMVDGELYTTQIYEWSEGAEPQQGNELTMDLPVREFEAIHQHVAKGRALNGVVKHMDKASKDQLEAQGIVSILIVPVFLEDKFWGFVGFDDCVNERIFSDDEEAILLSGSLLISNALVRNEITRSLVEAREEALAGTRAKSEFLADMSHELRTPIGAITGMTTIARSATDPKKLHDCLDKIDIASKQLLALVGDVLDMSKIESRHLELASEPFDLATTIKNATDMMVTRTSDKHQSFTVELSDNLPDVVIGDDMRFSQVLLNLLSNAVKFTPEHGQIAFVARSLGIKDGRCQLEITVRDNGIGMSEEQISRLFLKFEQGDRGTARQYGGSGLGLAISKNFATLMGGDILVESKPGEGSTFVALFSLQIGSRDMLSADEAPVKYDFGGRTALLVEDVEINREIVFELMADTGLSLESAEDGRQALDMFKADPDKYDIIYMDIHMPVMDGYEATRALRALEIDKARSIPIVAMTANAFSDDVVKCKQAGMNDHISKPIDLNVLLQKTQHHLNDASSV